jgi:hypothetical protein
MPTMEPKMLATTPTRKISINSTGLNGSCLIQNP